MQRLLVAVSVCCLGLLLCSPAEAQTGGTVTGTVRDTRIRTALPGAQVRLVGTGLTAVTGSRGFYRIVDVPSGDYEVEASYLGFDPATAKVTVVAGETVTADLELPLAGFEEEVTVVAPILQGQAKALNQQQNAANVRNVISGDQIGDFPDRNSAEALQRVPGVAIERDQGEGRYVYVRGTEPRLNAMEINGQRIPAPDGEVRQVALDVIPADLLESIEVSKTLTPDMWGDSIGGTVNLVTAQAPEKNRLFITAAGGYNSIASGGASGRFTGMWAGRFGADQRAGLVLSGSYFNTDRGSENFEVEYDDGELEELEQRDYTVNRERWGLNAAFDYRLPNNGLFYVRGIYNNFADQEYRRRKRNRVGDDRIERELKDRLETQEIAAVSVGGRNALGRGLWTLDYEAAWAYAAEEEPDRHDTNFRQDDVEFDPNVSADFIDPGNIQANPLNEDFNEFTLDEQVVENNFTSDRDFVAQTNLTRVLGSTGFFKLGAQYRDKNKERDNNSVVFESEDNLFLSSFTDPDFDPNKQIIDGRYTMGSFVGASQARGFTGLEGEIDREVDAANYNAKERVYAGYAMAQLNYGDLLILPGIRYEQTDIDYTGNEVIFDEEGDYQSTNPVSGSNDYGTWMPHLHFRYRLGESGRTNLRAAVTRTLGRPNYFNLVPSELVIREDREIERGNPNLKPTVSWNFDVLAEHFLPSVGVISGGFFHKRLDDFIYIFTFEEDRDGETFDVDQPLNGDRATLTGFEAAVSSARLVGGFGLLANYTYTDSEAAFPGREGEAAPLPGQAKHSGNVALLYEQGGFSGRLALNFKGRWIAEVGETPAEDISKDRHAQLDFAASQKIGDTGLRLYLEVLNLTNEPLRFYEGTEDRPIQEEYYRWWGAFGIKWDF
jgi:TonB-dependent receptor